VTTENLMPLARIITHAPESARSLADYLIRCGYSVEFAPPEETHESAAEIEITVDTCAREQARERAAQLAAQLGTDVVLAAGVMPAKAASIVERPAASGKNAETLARMRESILAGSRTAKESLGAWNRHLSNRVREIAAKSSVVVARWFRAFAQSGRQLWVQTRLAVGRGVATGRAKIRDARREAVARAQARIERQARTRELAQAQTQQPASAEPAPFSGPSVEHQEEAEVASVAAHPAQPLRRPPPPRSSLVAYTRNRDWKMAFFGATAASLLIMVVSFEFMSAMPPVHDPEQPQTLPLGAATVRPSAPALMAPAVPVEPAVAPPKAALIEKAKPVLKVEPVTTIASQAEPDDEEYVEEEVVIRHYEAGDPIKARIGEDGVKRISDQD
jgi:hypothetical protein